MRIRLNRYALFILWLTAVSAVVRAELPTVTWSKQLPDNGKFPFLKIIGSDDNGFYVLRSNLTLDDSRERSGFKTRKYLLQNYSLTLTMRWEQELHTTGEVRISGVYMVNDRPLVLSYAYDKAQKVFETFAQFMDGQGSYSGQPVRLDAIATEHFDDDNKPGIIASKSGALIAFACRKVTADENGQSVRAVVMDTALKVIYHKEIDLASSPKLFEPLDFLLTDAGNFFILGTRSSGEKRNKIPGENFYQLFGYNHSLDLTNVSEIRLSDKFLTDVSVAADNLNHRVVVAGFYSEKTNYSTAGAFYYSLSEDSLRAARVVSAQFSAQALQKFAGERKENKELVNYSIDRLVLRRDGGAVIVAESFVRTSRSYWDYYTQTLNTHSYYHFGSVMVLSVNPDGTILWNNAVTKDQNSIDDDGYYSSYCNMVSRGRFLLFYNKYIEDNSSVLLTTIDGQGSQRTDVLFDDLQKVTIIPKAAKQVDEETVVIPAYKENRFFLLRVEY